MAGKPGMKGGGGARPGAGRKRKPAATAVLPGDPNAPRDPLEFLLDVMQGKVDANAGQIRAATAAAQYVHAKKGEGGKKLDRQAAAKDAAQGKYAPQPAPKLAAVRPIRRDE